MFKWFDEWMLLLASPVIITGAAGILSELTTRVLKILMSNK